MALGGPETGWRRRYRTMLLLVPMLAHGPARAEDDPVRTVLFGSLDAGAATFLTTGAKVGLDRVDREGVAGLASLGAGVRFERGGPAPGRTAPTVVRTTWIGALTGGYQLFREWGVAALFAGPEVAGEALAGPGGLRTLPARYGLRVHGELWARPSEDTLTTATVILGSARGDAYGRLSWGTRIWETYLGPEAALYGDHTGYRKWSFGVHATDVAIGRFGLRASAGLQDDTGPSGLAPYLSLAAWTPW